MASKDTCNCLYGEPMIDANGNCTCQGSAFPLNTTGRTGRGILDTILSNPSGTVITNTGGAQGVKGLGVNTAGGFNIVNFIKQNPLIIGAGVLAVLWYFFLSGGGKAKSREVVSKTVY